MICPNCSIHSPEGSRFCFNCGCRIVGILEKAETDSIICDTCGCFNPSFSEFCATCGKSLGLYSLGEISYYPVKLSLTFPLARGVSVFQKHPKLLLITFFGFIVEILMQITILNLLSRQDSLISPYLNPTWISTQYFIPLTSCLTSFLISCLLVSWLLTSFKQTRSYSSDRSLDLQKSFNDGLKFLPSIIISALLMGIVTIVMNIGKEFIRMWYSDLIIKSMHPVYSYYYSYGSPIFIAAVLVPLIFFGVISIFQVVFSYVYQTIVLDELAVVKGFSQSWKFVKKYFWVTLGTTAIFTLSLIALHLFFGESSIITLLIMRFIQTSSILCFAWTYDEFKHSINGSRLQNQEFHQQNYFL